MPFGGLQRYLPEKESDRFRIRTLGTGPEFLGREVVLTSVELCECPSNLLLVHAIGLQTQSRFQLLPARHFLP
jgi:hypothetical protein